MVLPRRNKGGITMPTYTVSSSVEKFARIIAALDRRIEREGEGEERETDNDFYMRWLTAKHTELVFGDECRQAAGAIVADNTIVDVT